MWKSSTGPELPLNLQMNRNGTIRTASGGIDYCRVTQTSEDEDKSPPCTIRCLSAGDAKPSGFSSCWNGCKLSAACRLYQETHRDCLSELFNEDLIPKQWWLKKKRLQIYSLLFQWKDWLFQEKRKLWITYYYKCVIVWCLVQHISVIKSPDTPKSPHSRQDETHCRWGHGFPPPRTKGHSLSKGTHHID